MSKAMTKKEAQMPAFVSGAGRGVENVETSDLIIPRIVLAQDLSPQVKKGKPEYIEGLEPGMFFNSVSGEIYGAEFEFVPVYYRKEWVVWKNREAGGGFCGAFPTKEEAEQEAENLGTEPFGKKGLPLHEATDVAQHFGLIVKPDGLEEAVLSLSRSGMKVSRQLLTLARMAGGDYFASRYQISSVMETNNSGDEYWGMSVKRLGWVDEETYHAAEKVYEMVTSGRADVERPEEEK